MNKSSLDNINNNKAIFFCFALVVSILLINSVQALQPLCKLANGANFDGTWSYNDEGSANDFSVTCRNGRMTAFCSTAALERGPHWGVYTCESSVETSCNYFWDGGGPYGFNGVWSYNDDGSSNDFSVTCKNGKLDTFNIIPTMDRGFHWGDFGTGAPQISCKYPDGANFDGTWSYNDDGSSNDFSVTCRAGQLSAFCVTPAMDRGSHPGVYTCGGDDKDQDGVKYPQDCADNDATKYRTGNFYHDNDHDSYGAGAAVQVCYGATIPTGYSTNNLDCNDNNAAVHPGANEICNGIDDNCNGQIDENNGNCASGLTCSLGSCIVTEMYLPNMPTCNGNFGTVTGTSNISAFMTGVHQDNTPEHYTALTDKLLSRGNALDWYWVWISYPDYVQWDMGKLTNYLRVFPSQDHGPYPGEIEEYDVLVSADGNTFTKLNAIATYVNDANNVKTHDGVRDYYSLNQFRYVRISPNLIIPSADEFEIDAIKECSGSVRCSNNNQCGTDGFVGDPVCQNGNVYQNYKTYTCNEPGKLTSTCTDSTNLILKTTCTQGCSNGACITVTCHNDSECNDNNPNTHDVCINPGTNQSRCEHNTIRCNNNSECGTNGFTGDLFCQDGNVFQNYITFACNHPGSSCSSCTNSSEAILKSLCSFGCTNGYCINNNIIVNLISPVNNSVFSNSPSEVEFIFNVTSNSNIKNCSVNISGNIYTNTSAISKTTNNSIKLNLTTGNYNALFSVWMKIIIKEKVKKSILMLTLADLAVHVQMTILHQDILLI